jgi:hypothetical protein
MIPLRSKTHLILLFCMILITKKGISNSYYSSGSGYWNSSSTWLNGQIPPLTNGDSIYIQSDVMYTTSLHLNPAIYCQIDSGASLCGHHLFLVHSGSLLHNYGTLYADTLGIGSGGQVDNYGYMQITNFGLILGVLNSGAMQVGGSFVCMSKSIGASEYNAETNSLYVFPNPSKKGDNLQLSEYALVNRICVLNLEGQVFIESYSFNGEISTTDLPVGVYILLLMGDSELPIPIKFVIID